MTTTDWLQALFSIAAIVIWARTTTPEEKEVYMQVIEFLKRYWKAFAAGLLGLAYVIYRGKVREIEELSAENVTATKQGELNVLETQQVQTQAVAQTAISNYDALLNSNRELASKLGIGPGSKPDAQ